jgi:G:T-mismatch repair DNA endonuclease (very short patch repair protein)
MTEEHKQKISMALKGKPRFYCREKNNPNYGGKYSNDPEIKKKYLRSVKERGQCWSDEIIKAHSEKMMGKSNWMRGRHHTQETIEKIRKHIVDDFSSGKRSLTKVMVSKPEREISELCKSIGFQIKMGYRIKSINKLYDIYLPEKNLIIEFNGDYWHMNPSKYKSTDYNKAVGLSAQKIWERDESKRMIAINNGYKICYVWESDYKKISNKKEWISNLTNQF